MDKKKYVVYGYFGGAEQEIIYANYETRFPISKKPIGVGHLYTTLYQEIDDSNSSAIPLWLTPSHGGMLRIEAIGLDKNDLILGCIEKIEILPEPNCKTKIEYSVGIAEPFISNFEKILRSQQNNATGLLCLVPNTVTFTQAD